MTAVLLSHAVGIKVMVQLTGLVDPVVGNNGDDPNPLKQRNSSNDWTRLTSAVEELKGHPAVLGWCVITLSIESSGGSCCSSVLLLLLILRGFTVQKKSGIYVMTAVSP